MRSMTAGLVVAVAVLLVVSAAWAGVPCRGTSSIGAEADSAGAGDTLVIYVNIRDCYGQPLGNRVCQFISSRGDSDEIIGNPATTDANGDAQADITTGYQHCVGPTAESVISVFCEGVTIDQPYTAITWIYTAGLEPDRSFSVDFDLYVAGPNPFSTDTQIGYAVRRDAAVSLAIFDVSGRRVKTLINGNVPMGCYTAVWDGRDNQKRPVAPGIYYARMVSGDFTGTTKLMYLK